MIKQPTQKAYPVLVAIVPALNEAQNIAHVVQALLSLQSGDQQALFAAVVVGDNGSTDGTEKIARAANALVAQSSQRGYGHGCVSAIGLAHQSIADIDAFVFVDGDHSTRYEQIFDLVAAYHAGHKLVIGRRVDRAVGSMSLPQRFGNQLCCALVSLLWRKPVHDLGPLRLCDTKLYQKLNMQALTFGWTVEMQIKAIEQQVSIAEVPVSVLARLNGDSKVSPSIAGALRCGRVMLKTIYQLYRTKASRHRSTKTKGAHVSLCPTIDT